MIIVDKIEILKSEKENIIDSEYIILDLETTGLKFTDDILSIQIKTNKELYYLPFDTIEKWRELSKHQKPEKKKKTPTKKTAKQIQQTLFNLDDYVIIPEGLIKDEDLPIKDEVKQSEQKPEKQPEQEINHLFLNWDQCLSLLNDIFNSDTPKIAHHMKFDAKLLIWHKVNFKNWYFDTMLAAWTLKEDRMTYSLKPLYQEFTGEQVDSFTDLIKNKNYWELQNHEMIKYAMHDCDFTEFLYFKFKNKIFSKYADFFKNQMMDVCEVLAYMELNGCFVDKEYGEKYTEEKMCKIEAIQIEISEYLIQNGFDGSINLNSNPQLVDLFYEKFGYTYKNKRSVDKFALNHWAEKGSFLAKKLLEYRQNCDLVKFISDDKKGSVLSNINEITGRVHTTFNQHRTVMHRLSSSDPNFQNLPRQGDIRKIIMAPEGKNLFIIDYSQIELRCFAHYSQDPKFLDAYCSDNPIDIHEQTRKNIIEPIFYNLDKKEQRSKAKNVNFGAWYGVSDQGLANLLNIEKDKARRILHDLYSYYNVNAEWIEKVKRWTKKNKWVGNIYGGKRRFYNFDFNQKNYGKVNYIYREAVHFIISSTAACILKNKMITLHKKLNLAKRSDIKMIIQIHDELIFEIPESYDPQEIVKIMEEPEDKFSIPLKTDYEIKKRWTK